MILILVSCTNEESTLDVADHVWELQDQWDLEQAVFDPRAMWMDAGEHAYRLLTENMQIIGTVNDWASLAGCSRSWLGRCIRKHYGKSAKLILREERYKKIVSVIEENPHALAAVVAGLAAPWDEKRLCNFLTYHFHTNFTELRHEVLNGKFAKSQKNFP